MSPTYRILYQKNVACDGHQDNFQFKIQIDHIS